VLTVAVNICCIFKLVEGFCIKVEVNMYLNTCFNILHDYRKFGMSLEAGLKISLAGNQ
jgi:hypothetical protein